MEILVGEDTYRSTELFDLLTETRGAKLVYFTELAIRNMHLTGGQAEEIARLSNARKLVKFHFSDRYDEEDENSNT